MVPALLRGVAKNLFAMTVANIHPEYRLIEGATKEEVERIAALYFKEGWIALYDPIFGPPAAWETRKCWSQTLFRPVRINPPSPPQESDGGSR